MGSRYDGVGAAPPVVEGLKKGEVLVNIANCHSNPFSHKYVKIRKALISAVVLV